MHTSPATTNSRAILVGPSGRATTAAQCPLLSSAVWGQAHRDEPLPVWWCLHFSGLPSGGKCLHERRDLDRREFGKGIRYRVSRSKRAIGRLSMRWWSGPNGAYLIDHLQCSLLVARSETRRWSWSSPAWARQAASHRRRVWLDRARFLWPMPPCSIVPPARCTG